MCDTPVCEVLGIEQPIVQAPMAADAQWYPNLYDVGWPDSPRRALRNSTAKAWEAAGRPQTISGQETAT